MQRKGSLPGKIFARCILQRRFAGLFGYMARIPCQSQLILNTRRRYIATKGPFSRPRPFLGYIGAEYCHRQALGNAFRGHLAVAERPRAHCEHTLLYTGLRGMQFAGICLPCPTARWRTAAAYRQQSHPSAAQGAACSFPPYPARAHPRDAAVPSCGGGRRRDERAGTLARAAYWEGAREGH